jgi:hypothetical protein
LNDALPYLLEGVVDGGFDDNCLVLVCSVGALAIAHPLTLSRQQLTQRLFDRSPSMKAVLACLWVLLGQSCWCKACSPRSWGHLSVAFTTALHGKNCSLPRCRFLCWSSREGPPSTSQPDVPPWSSREGPPSTSQPDVPPWSSREGPPSTSQPDVPPYEQEVSASTHHPSLSVA